MTTSSYINSQKGFAALIGLLFAILIIALLVYGGSFFSKKQTKSQLETYVDVKEKAEIDISGIEDAVRQKSIEMNR